MYLKFVKKQEVPEHRFQNKIEQLTILLQYHYKLFNYHKYKKTLLVGLSGVRDRKSAIAKF